MGWVNSCGASCALAVLLVAAGAAAQDAPHAPDAPDADPPPVAPDADEAPPSADSEAASDDASPAPEPPAQLAAPADPPPVQVDAIPPPTTDVTLPAGYAEPGTDEVWALYHRAALALADDDEELAIELLLRIRQTPSHPAADQAARMLERLGVEEDRPTRSGERRSGLARAELIGFQTLGAVGFANMLCAFGCEGPRAFVAANLLGAGAGLALSTALSRNGVTYGQSNLYNSVHRWGTLNGFLLFGALGISFREGDDFEGDIDINFNALLVSLLLGQVLGLGSAFAIDRLVGPTGGDVALIDSLMLLSSASISLFVPSIARDFSARGVRGWFGALLAGNALSIALGAHLATQHDPSRARALLLDVGTGVGIGTAVALAAAFQRGSIDGDILLGLGAAGGIAGFVFAWWLTRNFDRRRDDDEMASRLRIGVGPTEGGAVGNLRVAF